METSSSIPGSSTKVRPLAPLGATVLPLVTEVSPSGALMEFPPLASSMVATNLFSGALGQPPLWLLLRMWVLHLFLL